MKRFSDVLPGIIIALVIVFGGLFFWQKQGGFNGKFVSEGEIVSETRDVVGFNRVSILGSGLVILDQGQEEALRVEADENLMEYITTKVSDGELEISYRNLPSSLRFSEVKFYLTVKELGKINLSGSAKLESLPLLGDKLELVIDGSGQMKMELEVENLVADLDGSGRFELKGVADKQQIAVSGSGDYYGKELAGKEGAVNLEGSGRVEVNVSDRLSVSTSGSGSVYYLGDPTMSEVNVSGSGEVKRF